MPVWNYHCASLSGTSPIERCQQGALPDEVPYNLINEASVADLAGKVSGCRVTARNFRPNFVLRGSARPYEEDNWKFVKIGEHVFEIVKPCFRLVYKTTFHLFCCWMTVFRLQPSPRRADDAELLSGTMAVYTQVLYRHLDIIIILVSTSVTAAVDKRPKDRPNVLERN